MSTETKDQLMAKLMAITTANTVKGRGASGKTTYLDRFVNILLDENGNPTAGKTRTQIIAIMSYDIALEQRESEREANQELAEFSLESAEDLAIFADLNEKCKNQVAAAVSDSNNATALSFNAQYKDVWQVVKIGNLVSLAPKSADAPATETAASDKPAKAPKAEAANA
jgi:hypothetical protein